MELVYRGLYHFFVARQKGLATDLVQYFVAPDNQDLGIVKRLSKPKVKLIVAPFPDRQRGSENFFFKPTAERPLQTSV